MLWVWGGYAMCLAVCGWALWRGSPAERIGGAVILSAWCLNLVVREASPAAVIVIDILHMVAVIALSLWSRRLWTLFAGALMIDTVASHAFADVTYARTWTDLTALGLLLCLAIGTFGHERSRRKAARPTTRLTAEISLPFRAE